MADKETLNSMLIRFERYMLYEKGCSNLTCDAYMIDIRHFASYLLGKSEGDSSAPIHRETLRGIMSAHIEWGSITRNDIRGWLRHLSENSNSTSTIIRKLQSLRSLFNYLLKMHELKKNPCLDIQAPKQKKTLPDIVPPEEMERVLSEENVDKSDFLSVRNHLVVNLLYSLGLRRTEVVCINDEDINLHSKMIKINGKGNRHRYLPLPDSLVSEIMHYFRLRDADAPDLVPDFTGKTPFLLNRRKRISQMKVYSIVSDSLSGTSVRRKSPHVLRHSCATGMLNNGADLNSVKELLGHSNLGTTQIYTHLSTRDLMQAYSHCHPRGETEEEKRNKSEKKMSSE